MWMSALNGPLHPAHCDFSTMVVPLLAGLGLPPCSSHFHTGSCTYLPMPLHFFRVCHFFLHAASWHLSGLCELLKCFSHQAHTGLISGTRRWLEHFHASALPSLFFPLHLNCLWLVVIQFGSAHVTRCYFLAVFLTAFHVSIILC